MDREFSIKKFLWRLLWLLPLAYIGFGWWIGITYNNKPAYNYGPYKVPVEMWRNLVREGRWLFDPKDEDYNQLKVQATTKEKIVQEEEYQKKQKELYGFRSYSDYTRMWIFFVYPLIGKENFADVVKGVPVYDFSGGWVPQGGKEYFSGVDYSKAGAYDKNSVLGNYSFDEFHKFLREEGTKKDLKEFESRIFPAKIQIKLPWLYIDHLSLGQREVLHDGFFPEDVLGVIGILILIASMIFRSPMLWVYYLGWVFAGWLGGIGWHSSGLAFNTQGWQIMVRSFVPFFILGEARVFLVAAVLLSIPIFAIWGFVYLTKHVLPRKKREFDDFFKIDKDTQKRKELSIESVEYKKINYDMMKKLSEYKNKSQYFLGVDDNKKDICVDEGLLNHHVHVLGPTGSGKTSLVFLPLSKQAINKDRGCCFVDFKGDEVFKRCVQQEAIEKGKKFYYFSIDPNEESAGYDPLFSGDIHSKVDRIMSALELVYQGAAGFYSNVQAMTFIELLKEMTAEGRKINFRSVKDAMEAPDFLERVDVKSQEVKGLLAVLSRFGDIAVINKYQIDLAEIIKNGDVVFFALKSQVNTQLAEAVGRMLIIDIKAQAVGRKETDSPFFIFIDEFQNLACSHFVDVISKVRSANFCLVLGNQSRGNLASVSLAFENAIFTNTATKIIFMQEDPDDAKFWSYKTGQTTYQEKNMTQFDGTGIDGEQTRLDGRTSVQGSIHTAKKNYISENIFLRLPFSKSVVFSRGQLARIANHEFLFDKAERDRIISLPFTYKVPEEKQEAVLAAVAANQPKKGGLKNVNAHWQ